MNAEHSFLEQYLSAYVDGVPLEPDVQEKLQNLLQRPEYQQLYYHERAIRQLLRERRQRLQYPIPPELLPTIQRRLAPSRRIRQYRWIPAAIAAALAGIALTWYLTIPPRSSPPCFMTALLRGLDDLQHGRLSIEPLRDTIAVRSFLQQHGIPSSFVFPHVEEEAPLVGVAMHPVNSYRLPLLVYRTQNGWLLFAEAPEEDFQKGYLWLDSTIWHTVMNNAWYWGCPEQPHTCAFWKTRTMVCGIAATLPPEQVKQVLELE